MMITERNKYTFPTFTGECNILSDFAYDVQINLKLAKLFC